MTVKRQKPNNNRWQNKDFTKGAFLYGGKPRKLNNDEDSQVRDLGYGLVDVSEDTMAMLDRYVDEIDSVALNKNKLKRLLKNLYIEASEVE